MFNFNLLKVPTRYNFLPKISIKVDDQSVFSTKNSQKKTHTLL